MTNKNGGLGFHLYIDSRVCLRDICAGANRWRNFAIYEQES